jgi:ammonia channel protein AmtB
MVKIFELEKTSSCFVKDLVVKYTIMNYVILPQSLLFQKTFTGMFNTSTAKNENFKKKVIILAAICAKLTYSPVKAWCHGQSYMYENCRNRKFKKYVKFDRRGPIF